MNAEVRTDDLRTEVVAAAIDLFARQGYDQTTVDQIAQAAGVSRSTFFRQYGGKEDVIFIDHDIILEDMRQFLETSDLDAWHAACESAMRVFKYFARDPELARRRYAVVRQIPALRDREIVTVFRYEKRFAEFLRRSLPDLDPADAVAFASVVASVHNHVLRRLLRGADVQQDELRQALDRMLARFGVAEHPPGREDDLVVAVFPRSMATAELTRRLGAELGR